MGKPPSRQILSLEKISFSPSSSSWAFTFCLERLFSQILEYFLGEKASLSKAIKDTCKSGRKFANSRQKGFGIFWTVPTELRRHTKREKKYCKTESDEGNFLTLMWREQGSFQVSSTWSICTWLCAFPVTDTLFEVTVKVSTCNERVNYTCVEGKLTLNKAGKFFEVRKRKADSAVLSGHKAVNTFNIPKRVDLSKLKLSPFKPYLMLWLFLLEKVQFHRGWYGNMSSTHARVHHVCVSLITYFHVERTWRRCPWRFPPERFHQGIPVRIKITTFSYL